jgi:signal peptidase I
MNLAIENFKILMQKNHSAQIRVTSDSMKPLIKVGELLTVMPVEGPLKRFDVIVFDYHGTPFCHFFWGKLKDERVFTKSLKNPAQIDIPIFEKDIFGIVESKKIGIFFQIKIYLYLALRINAH